MGFFTSVQSHFADRATGRYIAAILVELYAAEPKVMQRFLAHIFGDESFLGSDISLTTEFSFIGAKGHWRRADLAIEVGGQLKALVELKFDDVLAPGDLDKPAQLADYISYCSKATGPRLLVLTKDPLTREENKKIEMRNGRHAYYGDLAPYLLSGDRPISKMTIDYLRELGLLMAPLDRDLLFNFLHRFVNPWEQSGKTNSKAAIAQGSAAFGSVLNNMVLIAQDITPVVQQATKSAVKRSASVDFAVQNWFRRQALEKCIAVAKKDPKTSYALPLDWTARTGGQICVYATNTLGTNVEQLRLEYGFEFDIEPRSWRTEPILVTLYAGIAGTPIRRYFNEDVPYTEKKLAWKHLGKAGGKPVIVGYLRELIREAVDQATLPAIKYPGQQRAILKRLQKLFS